jgi:hypothetical protein
VVDEYRAGHLRDALAVWDYSDQSACWCYGRSVGDPLADELWQAISHRPQGMTRTDIRDYFSRNKRRHDIDNALARLAHADTIECRRLAVANGPRRRDLVPEGLRRRGAAALKGLSESTTTGHPDRDP